MGFLLGRRGLIVTIACVVALASALGASARAQADTETETVLPGMYLALFYAMDDGVTLDFNVTSNVPVYVYVLDKANYDSYSVLGTIPSALYRTLSPVTVADSSVEAPADGKYYLIIENSASTQTASVTIEYSFGGTGMSAGVLIAIMVAAIIVIVVVVAIVMVRKKKQQAQPPVQQMGQQYPPPMPPPQP